MYLYIHFPSSAVDLTDLMEFSPHKEPFLSFTKENFFFLDDPAVKKALRYFETGDVPNGFRWSRWKIAKPDQDILEMDPIEYTKKGTLLLNYRKLVTGALPSHRPCFSIKSANTMMSLAHNLDDIVLVNHGQRKYRARVGLCSRRYCVLFIC